MYQAHCWWCRVPGASVRPLSPGRPEVVLMVMLYRMLVVSNEMVMLMVCADDGDINDIDDGGEDGGLEQFSACDAAGGDAQSGSSDEDGDDSINVSGGEDDDEGVDKLEDEVEVMLVLPMTTLKTIVLPMLIVKMMLKAMTMTKEGPIM